MQKNVFEQLMKMAIEEHTKYVVFVIEMPDLAIPEFIINTYENFQSKLDYVMETYNDNMEHKYSPGVRIKQIIVTNLLAEISCVILENSHQTRDLPNNLIN